MATVKKYNLAGVSTSLELGKQGSYITGNADAIGFYTSGDALQKVLCARRAEFRKGWGCGAYSGMQASFQAQAVGTG